MSGRYFTEMGLDSIVNCVVLTPILLLEIRKLKPAWKADIPEAIRSFNTEHQVLLYRINAAANKM